MPARPPRPRQVGTALARPPLDNRHLPRQARGRAKAVPTRTDGVYEIVVGVKPPGETEPARTGRRCH